MGRYSVHLEGDWISLVMNLKLRTVCNVKFHSPTMYRVNFEQDVSDV